MDEFDEVDYADLDVADSDEELDFADYNDDIKIPDINPDFEPEKNKYDLLFQKKNYDDTTTDYYRILRLRKLDPISQEELAEEHAFKFEYMWDPYTGERLEKDPYGPLYFDPDMLIKHFHSIRLRKLWNGPSDENNGYYQGYYEEGVGAGEKFNIVSRGGEHPEYYLFRLPIIDCYIPKDHNTQFITFGPKLTFEEIQEIERKAERRSTNYKQKFKTHRPSITKMFELYTNSIAKEPTIANREELSKEELLDAFNKANRTAVDVLVQMKG